MCMLTFLPPGVQPDTEALTNGATWNRDGHGFAVVVLGKRPRIIVRHGLDSRSLIESFAKLRRKHPQGPALFHSRYGTSGTYGTYNCHPFRMAGDRRTVVAHNGVLPAHMQPDKKDRRCDTRKAADDRFGTMYGHLSDADARDRLATDIGAGNKLVILTVDPAHPVNAYVINEGSGVWEEDGAWYSNHDYCPARSRWEKLEWDDGGDILLTGDGTPIECPYCQHYGDGVDSFTYVCRTCGTCIECEEYEADCMCLDSASARYDAEINGMTDDEWEDVNEHGGMRSETWLQEYLRKQEARGRAAVPQVLGTAPALPLFTLPD